MRFFASSVPLRVSPCVFQNKLGHLPLLLGAVSLVIAILVVICVVPRLRGCRLPPLQQAVVSLLAQVLGIAKSRVEIVRGHASREKMVVVWMAPEEVRRRLEAEAD